MTAKRFAHHRLALRVDAMNLEDTGFFSVLAEWSRAEMPSPANDAGKPDASDNGEARHDR
jgi:hypothetical protein